MSLKIGSIVQVWSETEYKCLGWGKIIQIGISIIKHEETPLIQLENGRQIWGDRVGWITEKKAVEIGLNVFLKTMGRKFS